MILPWITLAAVQAAFHTRLSRGQLLDTLGEDYIRTARAKGLSERRVVTWSPTSSSTSSARCLTPGSGSPEAR
jgi:ABC-type dipeptide/oligopeptide/nickel transport system permease component